MIPPLQAIRKILWGNVLINGKKVDVIQRDYPYDKTPCITIDDSGGSQMLRRYVLIEEYPLSPNHPQYVHDNPFKKFPQQVLREYFNTTININVWADTGDERENINNEVMKLFHEAQTDHYRYCKNFIDGECASLGGVCYATNSKFDKRGVKQQCPQPLLYKYSNVFTTYNLERDTFYIDAPFSLNDTSKDEMIYRSVFKLHTSYYIDHIIGGIVPRSVCVDTDEQVSYFIS